jgi:hypothetical protein
MMAFSVGLAWISMGFGSIQGWPGFLGVISLSAGILLAGWWVIRSDPEFQSCSTPHVQSTNAKSHRKRQFGSSLPSWLGWLLVGAALFRLGAGVLWFLSLPNLGYGSEVEMFGYVMADAFDRDMAAWNLAQSEKPLSAAFNEYHNADQYGGMLYGSALVYRYLGGSLHQPLQIVVLMAAFSALAVLFAWAFARRIWDGAVAGMSAWIVALFPDAVLLGSSQMREAIMMSFAAMAFYGLVRAWQDRSLTGVVWMVMPLMFALPLSPLFGVMLAVMLGVFALFLGGGGWLKNWYVYAVLIGLVVMGLIVVGLFGEQILPGGESNPVALLQRWLRQAARWQAYNAEHASGWMQKIFRSTPPWMHTWLLLIYGIVRPFLPAALFDPAATVWQAIVVWRSLGWAVLLPFLIAAPLISWRRTGWRSQAVGLSILVWTGILAASFRGGGDNWDNPRYRVTWIGLQAALAAWVWITLRRDDSPWLRRIFVGMGLILIWWMPWYLRRVTDFVWPVQNVFLTLGLGVLSALLYLGVDICFERKRKSDSVRLIRDD